MQVRRGFLFWGSFFVLLGAVPLAVREFNLDVGKFASADTIWPIALIVVGALLLLSRSRLNVVAVITAGVVLGALGGTALANGSLGVLGSVGCGSTGSGDLPHVTRSGTFQGDASMDLHLSCGTLMVRPVSGTNWAVDGAYRGAGASIDASPTSLRVRSPDQPFQHQDWTVDLPTAAVHEMDVQVDAGSGSIDLGAATLRDLSLQTNAADVRVSAAEAPIGNLQVEANAGRVRITLGASVTSGNLQANAGGIDLCVPASAAVSLQVTDNLTFGTNLGQSGLSHVGSTWSRPGSGGPTIHLSVEGNAASFNLNPEGGCS